jgi:hypothetical protein
MNLVRKAITSLGGIFLAALLITALAPKAAHGIAAALVQVANTSANPVPTVSADANFPFEALLCGDCSSRPGSFSVPSVTTTGVPVKRLVIEDVNAQCQFPPTPTPAPGLIVLALPFSADSTNTSEDEPNMFPAFNLTVGAGGAYGHAIVRMYADPLAQVSLAVVSGPGCGVLLTGHLETK